MFNPEMNTVVAGVLKVLSRLSRRLADTVDRVVDFAYVKVLGVPFVVLGYRQTGKTTLLEWLRRDMSYVGDFEPDPTAAGGDPVPVFTANIGDNGMRLRPKRDVGGEYSMWETDWVDLFRQARPRGLIYLIDHTNLYQHKDALNFALQLIDDEPEARKHLCMFLLLVNKQDLWQEEQTLDDILDGYRNEVRRLKSQAERLGYRYLIASSSLLEGDGIEDSMRVFFNAIRPRPAYAPEAAADAPAGD